MEDGPIHLEAASRLPAGIRFGTSSWIYPGWKGLVYRDYYPTERDFQRNCLREYAAFPWFRTVGIDSTFYAPPRVEQLRRYADLLPEGFPWVAKLWQELTIARFPEVERWKERAGRTNPRFLDAGVLRREVLPAFRDQAIADRTGALVLQFPRLPLRELPAAAFLERLDSFLAEVPEGLRIAVEVRNPELLTPEHFAVLNRHGATHVFSHWTSMPRLREQMQAAADAGGLKANFFVARLLTPRGLAYADAVKRFEPYTELRQPDEAARTDAVTLARRALQRRGDAFLLVNNRFEGCAPRTIAAIGSRLVGSLFARPPG